LTPKQARFVREYLKDMNGAAAAVRAGYSPRAAKEQAARLLTKVHVQAVVKTKTKTQLAALDASSDRIILEVVRIAFSDIRGMFDEQGNLRPIRDLTDDQAATLASVEVVRTNLVKAGVRGEWVHKVRTWDKPKALELLMKKLGMLAERHRHDWDGPLKITLSLGNRVVEHADDGEVQEAPALLEESKLTH